MPNSLAGFKRFSCHCWNLHAAELFSAAHGKLPSEAEEHNQTMLGGQAADEGDACSPCETESNGDVSSSDYMHTRAMHW